MNATDTDAVRARYESLLEVSQFIVTHRDMAGLLRALRFSLQRLVAFDGISLTLFDPERRTIRLYMVEAFLPQVPREFELPVEETPAAIALETLQPVYLPDITQETRFPRLRARLEPLGIRSACMIPMVTGQGFLGTLNFVALRVDAYTPEDIEFMRQVASQVSIAVENALNHESAAAYQSKLARERDRLQLLLEVNNAVVQQLDTKELFKTVAACVRRVLSVELITVTLRDEEARVMRAFVVDHLEEEGFLGELGGAPYEHSPAAWALDAGRPMVYDRSQLDTIDNPLVKRFADAGFVCACVVPLLCRGRGLGTINALSRREKAFPPEAVELLTQVAAQVAIALDNSLAYRRIAELNAKLSEEKLYLEDEIRSQFEEIIGRSPALNSVLKQIETVAPLDSTVLLTGETGTGKEVIARAIHNRSARRGRTFVKVNCAAIPNGLLESELFGHEKGAFTGAIAARVGRFELADHGTLFLDEVGEIPLELQPKLLRVLQEREFERLGSSRTRRADVRVVAATNRNIREMVQAKEFRADLYYRLNVFPIHVPPLRERREDIPLLVRYFAQVHAQNMGKAISTIPSETLERLEHYPWPGNVRELQNLIERSVILSPGSVLRVPLEELRAADEMSPTGQARTLEEADRKHILEALEATDWVLAGPRGAAARLGLKRSTLQFRMAKLGIHEAPSFAMIHGIRIEEILLIASLLLFAGILASKASSRFGIPALLLFLVVGMIAGSEGAGGIPYDDPVSAQFLGVVALAFILFAGGLETSRASFSQVLWQGLSLATVGVLVTAIAVGWFARAVLGFGWLEGLLLGAIVSSTDAAAVFSVLRSQNIELKGSTGALLEFESGSNDPMAVFLTTALIGLIGDRQSSWVPLIPAFVLQMVLGVVLGFAVGKAMVYLLNRMNLVAEGLYPVATMAAVLLTYGGSSLVGGNGFLAVYIAGIVLGNADFIHKRSIIRFHDGVAWLLQMAMFLVLGLLVFPSRLLPVAGSALLVSAFLILVARPAAVLLGLSLSRLDLRQKVFVSWVGLRGAVPIVLATFPYLAGVPNADLYFNVVFFIVLTSVLVQGTSIPLVASWLGLKAPVTVRRRYPLEFVPTSKSRSEMVEVAVSGTSTAAGSRIMDLHLPASALVVLIGRGDDFISPRGGTRLERGDTLLVLTDKEEAGAVRALFESDPE